MSVPKVVLGDVVEILSGFAFKSELFNDSDGMPLIRIRDVVRGYTDTRYSGTYTDQYVVQNGEIVIGMDGNFNAARWGGGPALLNQRVCKISAKVGKLDDGYLFHFLPSVLKKIEDATPFVTVKHLSAGDLKAESIPLPPLPEQRRIAAILDQADALRAKRREALAQLDSLTQSIFIEMFGEPETNPKKWPIVPLAEQASVIGGYAFKSSDYVSSGIPLIRIGDVNRGGFNNESACFLPEEFTERYSRFIVFPGDLLMSLTGTTGKDDYGNITVLGPERENYLLNQRVACIRPRSNLVTREYLANFLGNKKIKDRIISRSRGVRQANISNPDILELSFPLPPVELQNKFAQSVDSVRNLKSHHLATAVQSEIFFTSLQHRAFRGEL